MSHANMEVRNALKLYLNGRNNCDKKLQKLIFSILGCAATQWKSCTFILK